MELSKAVVRLARNARVQGSPVLRMLLNFSSAVSRLVDARALMSVLSSFTPTANINSNPLIQHCVSVIS